MMTEVERRFEVGNESDNSRRIWKRDKRRVTGKIQCFLEASKH
jgi:hypothetical protein